MVSGLLARFVRWLVRGREAAARRRRAAGELVTRGEVAVRVYDEASLREAARRRDLDYDALDRDGRAALAEDAEPTGDGFTTNDTLPAFHEWIVNANDPNTTAGDATVSHLAVGTDGSETANNDGTLNNPVYYLEPRTFENRGRDLFTTSFLDTSEANDYTLREVGLATGNSDADMTLNRATIPEIVKTSKVAVTIDVTLKMRGA